MRLPWLPRVPDAKCPRCGESDHGLIGKLFRTDLAGQRREVGSLCRCTRCLAEFAVGESGVYEPAQRAAATAPSANGKKKDEIERQPPIRSAAADEDWSAHTPRRR